MSNEKLIQAIANTFLDRYAREQIDAQPFVENGANISAIALATAEATLKTVSLHSRLCQIRRKRASQGE